MVVSMVEKKAIYLVSLWARQMAEKRVEKMVWKMVVG